MNSQKAYEVGSLRTALTGYLDSLEEEITLGTHERHLRRLVHLCRLVLGRIEALGSVTLETVALAKRIAQLSAVVERDAEQREAAEKGARPSSPPSLRVVH